ncbi:MAG: protein-L-isoaspartate O-methyltransferase [Rhodobacterales bacterium]|nr:MAG: protein-L-isoaspartate O-methyltransferase [Rhodobacterales bacterium]
MADFATSRTTMVDTQIRPSDVTKYPIIQAMLAIPREIFLPGGLRPVAYADRDQPLEGGRYVLAPRSFAKMLDAANVGAEDVVLDLGCGLGYSTAVLAHMAKTVVAVEENGSHAEDAQSALSEAGVDNAAVIAGPMAAGEPKSGPYDVIMVQGAIETWPEALTDQLCEGGRAVALWAEGHNCTARLGHKLDGRMIWRDLFSASAPVLPGFARVQEFAF